MNLHDDYFVTSAESFPGLYCPYCSDGKGRHPPLVLGDHEGFGDYYPAYCRSCNETFEVPSNLVERND